MAIDMRCTECQAIGCECPRGYFTGEMLCDVCAFRFVLAKTNCAPEITCPECNGSVSEAVQE
jgi:hypothetical protein